MVYFYARGGEVIEEQSMYSFVCLNVILYGTCLHSDWTIMVLIVRS